MISISTFSTNINKLIFSSIVLILLSIFPKLISAQDLSATVISSGGKAITGTNIILSYTVGESIATVKTTSNAILIQGFEQPKIDTISVSVFEDNLNFPIKIYPNPTIGPINIDIESPKPIDWMVSIYNLQAQIMSTYPINIGHNSISIHQFPTASYVLVISTKTGVNLSSHIIEKIN